MRRTDRPGGRLLLAHVVVIVTLGLVALGCSRAQDSNAPAGTSGGEGGGGGNVVGGAPDITKPQTGPPKPGGKLVYGLEAETDGWDPSQNRWAASGTQVAFAVFDPLIGLDKDFVPKPILAESMLAIDGFQTWNLTIRKGIKFHNGQDLNAAAVKKALDAVKGGLLTGAAMKPINSIEQTGDFTLQIKVREPWATLPSLFTSQIGVIPAPAQLDADKTTASQQPIGTGPFIFKEWQRDNKFVATKNPNYWQKGLPYLDEVEFRPIPDVNTRFTSLQSGDINLMTTTQPSISKKIEDAAKNGELQITRSRGNNDLIFVMMNLSKAPFDDLRVRQAMAYALDRKAVVELDGTDPSQIADSVFQTDSPWYTKQDYPNHDLEKAKQLIKEYTAAKGPVSFTFGSTPDAETLRPIQAIAEQFKAAGMSVEIRTMDQPTFVANTVTGNYEAQIFRLFGSPDPDGNYLWFISDNADGPLALNMARYKNPKIDQAMKDGRATIDQGPRKQAYDRLQAEQTAYLPYLWISHTRWALGADNTLRGLQGSNLPDGSPSPGLVAGLIGVTTMWFDK